MSRARDKGQSYQIFREAWLAFIHCAGRGLENISRESLKAEVTVEKVLFAPSKCWTQFVKIHEEFMQVMLIEWKMNLMSFISQCSIFFNIKHILKRKKSGN